MVCADKLDEQGLRGNSQHPMADGASRRADQRERRRAMKVGYCRVSTDDQSTDVQRDALTAAGCERIFEEKISGEQAENRPAFQECLRFVREGDCLCVTKLDRLARNT